MPEQSTTTGADAVILVAGLTPAWQQLLRFDALTLGEVNRAHEVHWCASGKVLNAAHCLHHLGGPVKALTVVGGATGAQIRQDAAGLGLDARWIDGTAPTRVCTTILDAARRTVTELVPEAGEIGESERAAFTAAYAEEAAAAAVAVLIGSVPAGTPAGFYRDLLARTPGRAVLDARPGTARSSLRKTVPHQTESRGAGANPRPRTARRRGVDRRHAGDE